MKTLNIAIILAIATFASACGLVEPGPDFTGIYQGQGTYSFNEDFGDLGYYEDDGVETASVTITRSESGRLLISGIEKCVLGATEYDDYFEVESTCIVDQEDGIRTTYDWTGEGELSESGKLLLNVSSTLVTTEKVLYEHGFEWEEFGTGEYVISFSGRPM